MFLDHVYHRLPAHFVLFFAYGLEKTWQVYQVKERQIQSVLLNYQYLVNEFPLSRLANSVSRVLSEWVTEGTPSTAATFFIKSPNSFCSLKRTAYVRVPQT